MDQDPAVMPAQVLEACSATSRTTNRARGTIACALAWMAVAGCVGARATREPDRVTQIASENGALAFKGTVTRVDWGWQYAYRVSLTVTLLPDAPTHPVQSIDLTACTLNAMQSVAKGRPDDLQYRRTLLLDEHLSHRRATARLRHLQFTVRKSALVGVTTMGLALTDGKTTWPVREDLH